MARAIPKAETDPDVMVQDARRQLHNIQELSGENTMSKERQSNKETKKKPAMTMKEKRSAKKAKKETKTFSISGSNH
jgi:hypothetical protein